MKVQSARIRRLTSCCLLLLLLSGCGITDAINERTYDAIDGPETVTIDGVVYRNGFYGDMNPMFGEKGSIGSETLQDEIVYNDGQYRYRRVDYAGHDWVHSDGGRTTGGVLYCAEEDWEDESAFYADPGNLDYLMGVGKYIAGDFVSVPDIDAEKFEELMAFGEAYRFRPFGPGEREAGAYRLPESVYSEGTAFSKKSKDGYFYKSSPLFFEHDGKLLLVFIQDGGAGNGGKKELAVIDVPDELGQYFLGVMEQMQE